MPDIVGSNPAGIELDGNPAFEHHGGGYPMLKTACLVYSLDSIRILSLNKVFVTITISRCVTRLLPLDV